MVTKPNRKRTTPEAKRRASTAQDVDSFRAIIESGKKLPASVKRRMPRDGAENLDHYLYGYPKKTR